MAQRLNSARMTTTTTGTGTVDLIAAVTGFATFAGAGAKSGVQYAYTIEDGSDFEHGIGTYTDAGTDTFSRDTVRLSQISGTPGTTKLTLSGTAQIYISVLAEDMREVLLADRTYYVDGASGSDSNAGLASGAAAFATIQKAIDTVGGLDVSIYNVTISIASGTYTASLTLKNFVGAGSCTFVSTSGTATVSTTSANCILGNNIVSSYIAGAGFKMQTTTGGSCLNLTASKFTIGACEFGACASAHLIMDAGCNVGTSASYTISGGANWHIYNSMSNFFYLGGTTVTLTGTPAFATRFYYGVGASAGRIVSVTFSGSATGQQYFVDQNSHLYLNGATLPGNAVGVRQGGGRVDQAGGGGIITIASGSLGTGTTLSITDIPQDYSYLILKIVGASSDTATRQVLVQLSTNNGSSYDSTAGNYPGRKVTGTTFTAKTLASLIESATVTAAQVFNADIYIHGYQAGPAAKRISARVTSNAVEYEVSASYLSASAVNALQVLWDASGNFDAGTYVLYGVA